MWGSVGKIHMLRHKLSKVTVDFSLKGKDRFRLSERRVGQPILWQPSAQQELRLKARLGRANGIY
ncbi:DNA mismatch repair protein [Pasteurella multocida subsp. multocida str. Anand1_cattle]|nr:DNA mismatch repair protein [Pasteurella multocida subsp. multocida str. Anand1_cattle]